MAIIIDERVAVVKHKLVAIIGILQIGNPCASIKWILSAVVIEFQNGDVIAVIREILNIEEVEDRFFGAMVTNNC